MFFHSRPLEPYILFSNRNLQSWRRFPSLLSAYNLDKSWGWKKVVSLIGGMTGLSPLLINTLMTNCGIPWGIQQSKNWSALGARECQLFSHICSYNFYWQVSSWNHDWFWLDFFAIEALFYMQTQFWNDWLLFSHLWNFDRAFLRNKKCFTFLSLFNLGVEQIWALCDLNWHRHTFCTKEVYFVIYSRACPSKYFIKYSRVCPS